MEKLYGYRVPVRKYEKVEMDGGCDTMWRYLMLERNVHLEVVKMVNFAMSIIDSLKAERKRRKVGRKRNWKSMEIFIHWCLKYISEKKKDWKSII